MLRGYLAARGRVLTEPTRIAAGSYRQLCDWPSAEPARCAPRRRFLPARDEGEATACLQPRLSGCPRSESRV